MSQLSFEEALEQCRNLIVAGDAAHASYLLQQMIKIQPNHAEVSQMLAQVTASMPVVKMLDGHKKYLRASSWMAGQSFIHQLLSSPLYQDPKRLERHGRKNFSQADEDGIIEEIFRRIGVTNRRFMEFGVGDGHENNTLALMFQDWRGVWLEVDEGAAHAIRGHFKGWIEEGRLTFRQLAVNAENINDILRELQLPFDLDLLSIDIDGNDYHVFNAITAVRPRVVIVEYNPVLPPSSRVVMSYDANRRWDGGTYNGASLGALTALAKEKGYRLVGTNLVGINAFFVREEDAQDRFAEPATAEALYNPQRVILLAGDTFFNPQPFSMGPWDFK